MNSACGFGKSRLFSLDSYHVFVFLVVFQATASGQQYSDEAKFKPFYYWSYTIFQNKWCNTKYLSCDSTGNMTLVDMAELDYPNPQALFILNKV